MGLKIQAHVTISPLKKPFEDSLIYHVFAGNTAEVEWIQIITIF
jgi:hypothetical protein